MNLKNDGLLIITLILLALVAILIGEWAIFNYWDNIIDFIKKYV